MKKPSLHQSSLISCCRYPEKISFWHVEEVDDNGNVVRSVESSES